MKRHEAIAAAATRLFIERGYDATTLADVGEAAEVATRTVSLYFPTKLDLAFAYADAEADRLRQAIAERRPGQLVPTVVGDWVRSTTPISRARHRAMMEANPLLRGLKSAKLEAAELESAHALAEDLNRPVDDVVVALISGALAGMVAALLARDLDGAEFEAAIDSSMKLMRTMMRSARAA